MDLKIVEDKKVLNKFATHIMQSFEWGEFRKKLGTRVLRYAILEGGKITSAFQLTLHKIPLTNFNLGYLPKGPMPDQNLATALNIVAKENNCAFIKIEPNILSSERDKIDSNFSPSPKSYFTKFNFILSLDKSEEELLKNMHPKTRYNIKIAQKKEVKIEERDDQKALEIYLKLYFETTKRQGYLGHNENYHKLVWETLKKEGMARILLAFYKNTPLTAWMLLNFKDTLYYPYGGSSIEHKEVMANNLVAWEAIKLGKRLGLKKFDMWGALGPEVKESDPFYGFHKFKQGYGGLHQEYLGTYDLVINKPIYHFVTSLDKSAKIKALLLKFLG